MTNRKLILILVLFLLGLTGFRLLWSQFHPLPEQAHPVKGVLDLRNGGLEDRILSLNGEWEFYPSQWLPSSSGLSATAPTGRSFLHVPGSWTTAAWTDRENAYGYATYRLRILTDPGEQSFGFILSGIQTSSQLYVNGRLLGNSGTPAERRALYKASDVPYSASLTTATGELDIRIQTANYDNKNDGGILRPVLFGTEAAINKERMFSIGMQLMVCIVLMLHGLYAVILYLISPRQKVLLYFSLMVICATVSILSDDDKLLQVWLPLSLGFSTKLMLLAYLGTFVFMLQLGKHLLFSSVRLQPVNLLTLLSALFTLLIIIVPFNNKLFGAVSLIYLLLLFAMSVSVFMLILSSLKQKEDGAVFLLLAAASITSSTLWGVIKNFSPLGITFYPFDLIVAFLGFATFWFRRYFWNAEQTAKLAEHLTRAIKQKDDFLANTSHELRNPLHGIINIAQSVLESEQDSLRTENAANLELLITVGRRMSLLLNDLLDLSQLRESSLQLQPGPIQIQSLASGVLDMLRFMTDGKPLKLRMDIADAFPPVVGDEKRVIQILFNLLQNAVKYTPEGTVSIQAEAVRQTARIHVMDTGIGMDAETCNRIFLPYEQGDSSITGIGGGIGLGLSICKQLVELQGGTLSVTSELGAGSVFTFTLPLAGISAASDTESSSMTPPLLGNVYNEAAVSLPAAPAASMKTAADTVRVLAIDDDPVNLRVLSGILRANHHEIHTATSGAEALSRLGLEQWDLVISDVMMPGMSGYELTRIIREHYSVTDLPVLLLTARSEPQDMLAGFQAGANDYVSKPVNAIELRARVASLTELKSSVHKQLRLEAAYLQAQIQPHFLFNTLNAISALASLDTEKMLGMIDALSTYLRLSFNFLNAEPLIPIERELELVRTYLYIEKERFVERLDITWELDYAGYFLLPPLTIQPLVENAVRHGILNRSRGGNVHIAVTGSPENGFEVTISDNGKGMTLDQLQTLLDDPPAIDRGIGLLNTHRRLLRAYRSGLQIWSRPDEGTRVVFTVPPVISHH
ncbi:ATP-binding protein [Paenibacillus donghaensis]|uniref:Circadian input-output histidine kinase CikA n=1 Tax=Paenibacillus donghaensis TaxID=414771 RepID=A0A2Z2KNS3_9BACL|nr:ATP-binding protein [Paenibacillus donghaensis]ASA26135.1 hypothetical protein B9T62_01795 [Paenibacillus donghaensis]